MSDLVERSRSEIEIPWGVWCEKSGGVTGPGASWLKFNGVDFTGTRSEAEALARKWTQRRLSGAGEARFRYTPLMRPREPK